MIGKNYKRNLLMKKKNLKVLVADLERAVAELKAEVYADANAYSCLLYTSDAADE